MKTVFILVTSLILIASTGVSSESIYSLIVNGDIREAADSVSSASTASLRDGNMLFYASLLETDAGKSVRLMEAALSASVSTIHREEIHYRLAHYHFIAGESDKLGPLVADYMAKFETGKYRSQMQRFSVVVDEESKAYESALRQVDRYLLQCGQGEMSDWGQIDKARVMLSYNKKIGAYKVLRKVSRGKSGQGVPQALYMLASAAIADRRADDAVFFYNLLRESYPSAVGFGALVERMAALSSSDVSDHTAEELTGTFYSVQVGVFSVKANAERQGTIFGEYGKRVDIRDKRISQVKYYVVYAGRFSDYESAAAFKRKLEADHGEVFQVVAR